MNDIVKGPERVQEARRVVAELGGISLPEADGAPVEGVALPHTAALPHAPAALPHAPMATALPHAPAALPHAPAALPHTPK
jgi:hypothetical protein